MNITIYRNNSLNNSIYRNLTQVASLTGHLKGDCNVESPDIIVNYNAAYLTANYCYIPDFGRYYFFREPPTISGDIMTLHLHCDVLYTYRNAVFSSECIAERSSSNFNLYLPDSAVVGETGYHYFVKTLPYSFQADNGRYILTVAGN